MRTPDRASGGRERTDMKRDAESRIEGRNQVIEAFRAGKTIDRLFVLDGSDDGPLKTVKREAKKRNVRIEFVDRKRLDSLSETGNHQGVIAFAAAYEYSDLEDIFKKAEERQEDPFIFLLDGILDPHNLGAIIRTANMAGAHGVIIPKNNAAGLTPAAVRASAGAVNHTPVVRVTNLRNTILQLKERGLWFVCACLSGKSLYEQDLTGPLGIVIGSEGDGVGRLVRESCDFEVSIPTRGDLDSLNASVAAGVVAFEAVRQRG